MTPEEPASYPRRVLLCVVGLTPQVITETLYALIVLRKPPFVPTEVHVATTSEGRERILLTLLDPETGALLDFARDYAVDDLVAALPPERVRTIADASESLLDDIATDDENHAAADFLTRTVQDLTADADAALHVSIAGGRKTMGFFAGYALSLFGRRQDRLSHVLVPADFEAHPQFFYPPPKPKVLFTRDNRPVRTDAAGVILADIPFVRLRHGLPRHLLSGDSGYREAVAGVQERLGPPELVLDLAQRRMTAGGRPVPLPPVLFAWIAWLAMRCKRELPNGGALHWSEADAGELLAVFDRIAGTTEWATDRVRGSLEKGMTQEYFEEKKARYNKLVRDALGGAGEPYCLHAFGNRPRTRFGLRLPADAIRIVAGEDDSGGGTGHWQR